MTTKAKENIVTALYLLGAVILGALGAFILWATLGFATSPDSKCKSLNNQNNINYGNR